MSRAPLDLAAVVGAYADRMHSSIRSAHHVASPLGAWLVVALAASAAEDGADEALTSALGCPIADAHEAARDLLANPHPVLRLAAAAWHAVDSPELQRWLRGLGNGVEVGPVPAPAAADAWARAQTLGLIEAFPLDIGPDTLLVLASAVACAISWQVPFREADTAQLRLVPAPGFETVRAMLLSPRTAASTLIVDTSVGTMAVQAMASTEADMLVVSVIADPSVASPDVLAHAHRIATSLARAEPVIGRRSLFELALGPSHSWTLSEQTQSGSAGTEQFEAVLPAWSAESDHELLAMPSLGFAEAGAALIGLLPPELRDAVVAAKQVALARYTRSGFEAAAVTGLLTAAAMMVTQQVQVRTARIEFTHPYAVVAVAVERGGASRWAGLPLFSAWVTRADEAT